MVVQPLETAIVRSIDVHEGQTVQAGSGAGAARSHLRRRRCGRAGGAGGQPAGPGVAAAGGGRRTAVHLYRRSIRTWRCRRRSSASARPSTLQAGELHAEDQRHRVRRSPRPIPTRPAISSRLEVATSVEKMRKDLERLQVGSKLNTLAAMDNRVEMEREPAQRERNGGQRAARPRRAGRRARRLRADLARRHLGEAVRADSASCRMRASR